MTCGSWVHREAEVARYARDANSVRLVDVAIDRFEEAETRTVSGEPLKPSLSKCCNATRTYKGGDPGRTPTCDLGFRKALLYAAELRGQHADLTRRTP